MPIPFNEDKQALYASLHVVPAALGDCDDLWHWRNDLQTRLMSLSTSEVPYEDHLEWFDFVLSHPSQFLYMGKVLIANAESRTKNAGMVRFDILDKEPATALVSINLNPAARGKGLSGLILTKAIKAFTGDLVQLGTDDFCVKQIKAIIKQDNVASIKCFEGASFVKSEPSQPVDHDKGQVNHYCEYYLPLLV